MKLLPVFRLFIIFPLFLLLIGSISYNILPLSVHVAARADAALVSPKNDRDPTSSNSVGTMANNYIKGNYTNSLGPATPPPGTNIVTLTRVHVSNLNVDTFGGWFVYAVWQAHINQSNVIFFARSADGGKTWSPQENISSLVANSGNPHVGAFANEVYVTWEGNNPQNNDVFLRQSSDAGSTFGKQINLSNSASVLNATDSSLLVDKATGKVIVAWAAGNHGEVHCTRC